MTKTENLVTDLRHLTVGGRLQASDELKEVIRSWSLAGPQSEKQKQRDQSGWRTENHEEHENSSFAHGECSIVDLNIWIAARSRRKFEM